MELHGLGNLCQNIDVIPAEQAVRELAADVAGKIVRRAVHCVAPSSGWRGAQGRGAAAAHRGF